MFDAEVQMPNSSSFRHSDLGHRTFSRASSICMKLSTLFYCPPDIETGRSNAFPNGNKPIRLKKSGLPVPGAECERNGHYPYSPPLNLSNNFLRAVAEGITLSEPGRKGGSRRPTSGCLLNPAASASPAACGEACEWSMFEHFPQGSETRPELGRVFNIS
jgi:hypothetical protein